MSSPLTYLALGDSYTIGEGVALHESFPYQTVQLLRKDGKNFAAPEIIAKTGWSTSDLLMQLGQSVITGDYDFVTLLIGVNNQYRGLPVAAYTLEFEQLLDKSVAWAKGNSNHVFVLSIPDWSSTPYARGRDTTHISGEIAVFNNINQIIAKQRKVNYLDITTGAADNYNDLSYLSGDGLHPSAKAYARWARMLEAGILAVMGH